MATEVTELPTDTDWSWTLSRAFSTLVEPCSRLFEYVFWVNTPAKPGAFDNCTSVFWEYVYRGAVGLTTLVGGAVVVMLTPATILACGSLGYVSLLLGTRVGAWYLQHGKGFSYVKGEREEQELSDNNKTFSLMNWNVCGTWGGFGRSNGGIIEWRKRLEELVRKIEEADSDVLVLEEVYDTALAEKLIERLKDKYAHFFTNMGPNVFGSVGGLFVATKFSVNRFSHTSFENNDWTLNRGFAAIELGKGKPFATVIGTHLIHGDKPVDETKVPDSKNPHKKRLDQINQIVKQVADKAFKSPAFIAGDLNMLPKDIPAGKFHLPNDQIAVTCTNRFIQHGWDPKKEDAEERLDYIAEVQNGAAKATVAVKQLGIIEGKDKTSKTAASDHDALVATIVVA